MIFGSTRDSNLLLHIRRELVGDIVSQEILYYKLDLEATDEDIYGEAETKTYYVPVRLACFVERGDQAWKVEEYGPDLNREFSFRFIKEDLVDAGFRADVGDIIEWHNQYFEIDSVNENQYFVGRDEEYRLNSEDLHKFGESISIIARTHLTRYTKLNIVKTN